MTIVHAECGRVMVDDEALADRCRCFDLLRLNPVLYVRIVDPSSVAGDEIAADPDAEWLRRQAERV